MSKSDKLTRADLATLLGLLLILLACLLLTSTPQSVYRWMKRDGYTRTEIEVLSPPEGHLSTMRVRVPSTGEELSIKRNTFSDSRRRRRLPAWYNPEAQLILGFRLFDERIVSADVYPRLPGGGRVLGEVLSNLAAGAGGLYLLRSPRKAPRPRSRRRK
ncbi:MAG TPA: hypothetical protein VHN15_11400 [Thermoanaerobaculia bacterium]|nr:hypothetical protein [Thermoanaerobaculia bacterium]